MVSKRKGSSRPRPDGFDLDLSYIRPEIIASSYPSSVSLLCWNPYSEVVRFLETRHFGKYKVYNLCAEEKHSTYHDPDAFEGKVAFFPIERHHPPPLELIEKFCEDVKKFTSQGDDYVAFVHGFGSTDGRTAVMITCYVLYCQDFNTAEQGREFFRASTAKQGRKFLSRQYTSSRQLTIPSQYRYVQYFEERLKLDTWNPEYKQVYLHKITFNGIPNIEEKIKITALCEANEDNNKTKELQESERTDNSIIFYCENYPMMKDVKIICRYQTDTDELTRKPLLTVCFNTLFLKENSLHLERNEIDRAHTNKKKNLSDDFSIDIDYCQALNIKQAKISV